MQDEINEKVVALVIKVFTKTGELTKVELQKALATAEKELKQVEANINRKKEEKAERANQPKRGKQTIGELMKQNQGLTNIEITDQNIKDFEKTANEYNIDFALKKDINSPIPKYVVFFKARDVDVMTAAFKEYSAKELNKSKKPSIKKKLEKSQQRSKEKSQTKDRNKQREKTRTRSRERHL